MCVYSCAAQSFNSEQREHCKENKETDKVSKCHSINYGITKQIRKDFCMGENFKTYFMRPALCLCQSQTKGQVKKTAE